MAASTKHPSHSAHTSGRRDKTSLLPAANRTTQRRQNRTREFFPSNEEIRIEVDSTLDGKAGQTRRYICVFLRKMEAAEERWEPKEGKLSQSDAKSA